MGDADVSTACCGTGGFPKVFSLSELSVKRHLVGTDFENALRYVPRYLQNVSIHKTK